MIAGSAEFDLGYVPAGGGTQNKGEFNWGIRITSIVNEDSGDTIMILQHILQSKILHTDQITFDIAFTSSTDVS